MGCDEDECESGFMLNRGTKTCEQCTANCSICYFSGFCDECDRGFTLNRSTGRCEQCAANCQSCDTNGAGMCDECDWHFSLTIDNKTCAQCAPNCKSCARNGAGKCDECYSGGEGDFFDAWNHIEGYRDNLPAYVLSEDNTSCLACGQHC